MTSKIIKLIFNLLNQKTIRYYQGTTSIWSVTYSYLISKPFAIWLEGILSKYKTVGEILLYEIGKKHAILATEIMIKRYGIFFKGSYKIYIEQSDLIGFGMVNIIKADDKNNEYKIQVKNIPSTSSFKILFPKQNRKINYFFSGMMSGVLESIHNKKFETKELTCVARKNKVCTFESKVAEEGKGNEEIKREIDVSFRGAFAKMSAPVKKYNEKMPFIFKEGSINLLGNKGSLFPSYCFTMINKILIDINEKECKKLLERVAKKQIECLFCHQNMKIKNESDLKSILRILNLSCFGQFSVKRYNPTNLSFLIRCDNNPLAIEYKNMFGNQKEPKDFFISCLLKDLFTKAYNKKFIVKELKCIAQGKNECLFNVQVI